MADFSRIGKSNVQRSKTHERRIAKLLTEWSGVEFRRRRVEGRDSGVIDLERTADVIPATPEWSRFSIEAKCGEWGTFDALLTNPINTKFTEWWHQANFDTQLATESYNRLNPPSETWQDGAPKIVQIHPIIFFKPHKNFDWVAISEDVIGHLRGRNLEAYSRLWFPHLLFDHYKHCGQVSCNVVRTKNKKNFKFVPLTLPACYFCRWKDFAEHVHPRSFFIKWPAVEEKPISSESPEATKKKQP